MTTTSGHFEQREAGPTVRFERTFAHPPGAVWRAITNPAELEAWFPTTVEFSALTPGSPIEFHFAEDRYPSMRGEVREVVDQQRLAFTWGEDVLTFELEPRDDGASCRLAFTVVLDAAEKAARDSAGWETCLDGLEALIAGRAPERPAHDARWQKYYDQYRRMGLPATAEVPEIDVRAGAQNVATLCEVLKPDCL
jgi:uncharacterized protein YndB with AHSA1/START domain